MEPGDLKKHGDLFQMAPVIPLGFRGKTVPISEDHLLI